MIVTEMEKIGVCGRFILSFSSLVYAFCSSVKIFHKILHLLVVFLVLLSFYYISLSSSCCLSHSCFRKSSVGKLCMHIRVFSHFHAYEYKFVQTILSVRPESHTIYVFICNKVVCFRLFFFSIYIFACTRVRNLFFFLDSSFLNPFFLCTYTHMSVVWTKPITWQTTSQQWLKMWNIPIQKTLFNSTIIHS